MFFILYYHQKSNIVDVEPNLFQQHVHVAFDETIPQKSWKGSSSDVSGMVTERWVDNDTPKEDPPPIEEDIIEKTNGR